MTITRLFFCTTFAAGLAWSGVAPAHASPEEVPAAAATVGKPVTPVQMAPSPHKAAPAAKKSTKAAATRQASVGGGYPLSHRPHPLDSYQNAVTPRPAADR